MAPKDIVRFGAEFFVSSTVSRHLEEMKTSTNDKNSGNEGTLQFSEMVNGHFNKSHAFLNFLFWAECTLP